MFTLGNLDLAVLVGYFAGLFAMGLWFARKNRNTDEYFLGGRRFRGWVIGLSLVGTSISSITFLAYPGDAFKTAWLRYLPNLMLPVAVVTAAWFFLPFLRRRNSTTAYEYLEDRFGPSIRVYGALVFIVAQLVRVSLILYLIALVLEEITGLSSTWCLVIAGTVVAAYTVMGGIDAVIWTDVIQTIVLMAGGIICLYVIIDAMPGGLTQLLAIANEHDKLSLSELRGGELHAVTWDITLSSKSATMMLIIGLINWLTEYSSNQNTVQRFCASRSAAEARKAMFICALVSLPMWAFFMFLGTSLYAFFEVFPAAGASEILAGTRKAEEILPYFIANYLPAGVVGLVIAAALAAAMSSLDSSINAISTVSITDIYKRHLQPGRGDHHYLNVARLIASLAAVFMIAGAIVLTEAKTKTLQDTATILTSLVAGGLLSIYVIGFFTRRGDARHILCGIAGTMVFTAWAILGEAVLPDGLQYPFDLYYMGLLGNIIMFVIAWGLSFVFLPRKELRGLTVWSQ